MEAARNKCRAAVKSPWRSKIAFAKMQRLLVQLYSHGGLFCCFLGNHIGWAPSIQQLLCLKINPITRIKINLKMHQGLPQIFTETAETPCNLQTPNQRLEQIPFSHPSCSRTLPPSQIHRQASVRTDPKDG